MSSATATAQPTVGDLVLITERGIVIGGGLVLAIDGRDITVAQEVAHTIGADGAADTLDREELVAETYPLSRTVKAVVR